MPPRKELWATVPIFQQILCLVPFMAVYVLQSAIPYGCFEQSNIFVFHHHEGLVFFTSTFKLLWTWWLSWRGCNREVIFFTNYTLLLSVLSSSVVIINLLLKDSWVFLLTVKDRKGLSSIVKIYPKISGVKQRNLNSQPTNLTTQYFGFYSSPF